MAKQGREKARKLAEGDAGAKGAVRANPPSSTTAAPTLAARQQQRSRGRMAVAEARRRQQRLRRAILALIAVIVVAGGAYYAITQLGSDDGPQAIQTDEVATANGTPAPAGEAGVPFPDLGGGHVPEGQTVTTYNSDPPTSGQHWPVTADWGVHSEAIPNELQVHNLEHGGIVIQYDCPNGCDDIVRQLTAIVSRYPVKLILAPRPNMTHEIVLTAWGRMLTLDNFDNALIQNFINAYIDQGPEKIPSETQQLKHSQ